MSESGDPRPNQDQETYWQEDAGPKWAEHADQMDRRIGHLGDAAMERLGLTPGLSVLDVGCGCGATALQMAQRVEPGGSVTGVDLSQVMLDVGRARAEQQALHNVSFHRADVQTHTFSEPFDAVFSRFGVMFFDDPEAAFQNLAHTLRPGGRLAFVCWCSPKINPWLAVPRAAIEDLVEMPPPPDPGAPGPFAFADPKRVVGLLEQAGLKDAACDLQEAPLLLGDNPDSAIEFYFQLGPFAELLSETSPEVKARCMEALRLALEPFQTDDGVAMPTSTWVVSAAR